MARAASTALGVGALLALAGAAAFRTLLERAPHERSSPHVCAQRSAAAEPVALVLAAPPPEVECARDAPLPPSAEPAPARNAVAARVAPAMTELARMLADERATRIGWDTAVRATAGSLGPDGRAALLAASTCGDTDARVAAAEVLRALDHATTEHEPAALPAEALCTLRTAAGDHDAPLRAAAAARALAWFGDAGDRAALVDVLADPTAGERAATAAWALEDTHDDAVVLALADVVERARVTPEPVLVALERLVRATPALAGEVRDDLSHSLGARIAAAECTSGVRLRSVALLGTLGGDAARDALHALLADPAAAPALARAAAGALGGDASVELADVLARSELPHASRLAAAEALARLGDASEPALVDARLHLRSVAEASTVPSEQRRAVLALAQHGDADDLRWLEERGLSGAAADPLAAVR